MSGENLFCLAAMALLGSFLLLDNLIDAWRDRGRRRDDPTKKGSTDG